MEEEEEVFTEEEVEEIKPRRVQSQRKVLINYRINVLLKSYSEHSCIPTQLTCAHVCVWEKVFF